MIVWNEFLNDARVLKEAETLQSAGYAVRVHALHTPGVTCEFEILPSGVEVKRIARSPLWKWRKKKRVQASANTSGAPVQSAPTAPLTPFRLCLRMIARVWTHMGLAWGMIRFRPDVVHAHDVNTLHTAWLVSKVTRAKLIYDAHEISTSREGYRFFRKAVAWLENKIMPRTVGNITTTDARARFFARAYGIPRPLVLQNRPRLTSVPRNNRLREELHLSCPWPLVLYQGGLQQGRGLDTLMRAVALVPDIYAVFIGGGRMRKALEQMCTELKLQERVFFIHTVPLQELPFYTASADIGVQPVENTCLNHLTTDSNKLFEYVMAGLPVIATNLPEIRKVVRRWDLGLLVESGNVEDLAVALSGLCADSVLRDSFREKAEVAAHHLNWETQEAAFLDFYRKALQA